MSEETIPSKITWGKDTRLPINAIVDLLQGLLAAAKSIQARDPNEVVSFNNLFDLMLGVIEQAPGEYGLVSWIKFQLKRIEGV